MFLGDREPGQLNTSVPKSKVSATEFPPNQMSNRTSAEPSLSAKDLPPLLSKLILAFFSSSLLLVHLSALVQGPTKSSSPLGSFMLALNLSRVTSIFFLENTPTQFSSITWASVAKYGIRPFLGILEKSVTAWMDLFFDTWATLWTFASEVPSKYDKWEVGYGKSCRKNCLSNSSS